MRFVDDLHLFCMRSVLKCGFCCHKCPTTDLIQSLNNPTPAQPELFPPGSVENTGESLPPTTLTVRTSASNGAFLLAPHIPPP